MPSVSNWRFWKLSKFRVFTNPNSPEEAKVLLTVVHVNDLGKNSNKKIMDWDCDRERTDPRARCQVMRFYSPGSLELENKDFCILLSLATCLNKFE
jgi:hypothetical protein